MLERPYEMTRLGHVKNDTEFVRENPAVEQIFQFATFQIVQEMLRYTKKQPFIRPQAWKQKAEKLLRDFEFKLVYAVTVFPQKIQPPK